MSTHMDMVLLTHPDHWFLWQGCDNLSVPVIFNVPNNAANDPTIGYER